MKTSIFLSALVVSILTFPTGVNAALFKATLSGDQEVSPVSTGASGTATFFLNEAQNSLSISIQLFGIDLDGLQTADVGDDVTAMHIHAAPAGANGGIVFGFINPNHDLDGDLIIDAISGTVFSEWDLNEGNGTTLSQQLPNLFSEGLYLNVHTVQSPGGEIRGQITRVPEPGTLALLGIGLMGLAYRRKLSGS